MTDYFTEISIKLENIAKPLCKYRLVLEGMFFLLPKKYYQHLLVGNKHTTAHKIKMFLMSAEPRVATACVLVFVSSRVCFSADQAYAGGEDGA